MAEISTRNARHRTRLDVSERVGPDPRVVGALRDLEQAGLVARPVPGGADVTVEVEQPAWVDGDARIVPLALARHGFGEVPSGGGPGRLFVAFDPVGDRWIRLSVHVTEPRPARQRGAGARRSRILRALSAVAGRRAVWIALVGPDGVGKSSLAEALARSLPIKVGRYYAGLYPVGRRRYRLPGLGTLATLLRLWRTAGQAVMAGRRVRLVLFDRYPIDARLRAPDGAGLLARLRRAMLARAMPAPALLVILDAPVDVLRGRRAEQSVEQLDGLRRQYQELARAVGGSVVLDASGDLDAVRRQLTDLVWRCYAARTSRMA